EGWRNAKLGRLYKPVYFNYGIAIHGASNVPNYPASRGCVRYPMHVAEYIQDLVELGDAVYVFDGVEDPEHYGAQPMRFDWPDPDYTTTTSTTTSTSTTTTTQPPSTTTTSSPPPTPTTSTNPPTTTTSTTPTTSLPPEA
ncbi:L,D-transpeptidase family protein, partial [Ilumatobacter sp.]|uniref:L,D-transpeptidase family protein n=1 Tax=Ilumatobacter sp. TaxID=1967498 RepID=UPI003AF9B483